MNVLPTSPAARAAVRQGLSVSAATGLYGVSFGALSVAAGVGLGPTMALSLLMFSGGSQFALIGVIGAAGTPVAAIATATLLGLRNTLYGAVVSPLLQVRGWRRVAAAQVTIDESTAVAVAQPEPAASRIGFWVTGIGVYVLWNAFVLLGRWPATRSATRALGARRRRGRRVPRPRLARALAPRRSQARGRARSRGHRPADPVRPARHPGARRGGRGGDRRARRADHTRDP